MTDWIGFLIPAVIGLLLLLGGASVLRSNAHKRVVWKFPVGWFSVLLGSAAVFYAATVFPTNAISNDIAARGTTSTTTDVTTSSAPTTSLATTTLSYFAVPSEANARQWAEDAISYAESANWQWNNRDEAVQFYASYALQQCRYLSGDERFVPSRPGGGLRPPPPPGGYPPATPSQIEANLRAQLGIEAWEAYGMAWFDSLVNGLCVRR